MVTLTGTYGIANETAPTGYVDIQPMVTAVRLSTIITQAPVRADLDNGAISVDIVASDDAGWDNGPIPYVFTERINGQSAQWMAYVNGPGPVDMSDLIPLDLPPDMYVPVPGPPNVLTVDSTTTGDPGTDADVTISGTSPEQALAFTIPRGDQGDVGPPPHIGDDEPTDPEIVEWFDTNEPSVRGVLNSGDTMTGPLILSGDATDLLGAVPLQQLDAVGDSLIRITRPNVDDRLVEQWNGSAWSVVDYDSGWRSLVPENGWSASAGGGTSGLTIRRINSTVYFQIGYRFDGSAKTSSDFVTVPSGFRPIDGDFAGSLLSIAVGWADSTSSADLSSAGTPIPIRYRGILAKLSLNSSTVLNTANIQWVCLAPIPTTLPGTLVTPAPQ